MKRRQHSVLVVALRLLAAGGWRQVVAVAMAEKVRQPQETPTPVQGLAMEPPHTHTTHTTTTATTATTATRSDVLEGAWR